MQSRLFYFILLLILASGFTVLLFTIVLSREAGIHPNPAARNAVTLVRASVGHSPKLDYPDVHLLYNVGCDGNSSYGYQLIQALTLDWSWAEKKQPGRLTRIVSGCVDDASKKAAMEGTSLERAEDLSRFNVWFTEKNETLPDGSNYVMFNRPTALVKFFETQARDNNVIYGVLDPDFVFLQPLPLRALQLVKRGRPVAAYYDLGSLAPHWPDWGRSICEERYASSKSACKVFDDITVEKSKEHFEGGAPYLMFREDWLRLLTPWISLMLPTRKYWNMIEADMYAFMITCALLGIDHYIDRTLMKTCMIDDHVPMTAEDVFIHYCKQYVVIETRGGAYDLNKIWDLLTQTERDQMTSRGLRPLQGYAYVFSKYWLRVQPWQKWIFECEAPLLIEPPVLDEAHVKRLADAAPVKKNSKMLWLLVPAINNAMTAYKRNVCTRQGKEINLSKKTILHMGKVHPRKQLNSIIDV